MTNLIGPSGLRALPLAAGINVGGHYFRYFVTAQLNLNMSLSLT